MANTGKMFENDIKRSIPDHVLLYRIPDSAQSFGGGNKLRFSRKNPFDFLMWDSTHHTLFALEMKTVSGKSITFERSKEDHGEIHIHQIEGLSEWDQYDGIVCGLVIEFREIETTIFIRISDFKSLMNEIKKKSFSKKDLDFLHIPYLVIPQSLIKTRYKYDIGKFIQDVNDNRSMEDKEDNGGQKNGQENGN